MAWFVLWALPGDAVEVRLGIDANGVTAEQADALRASMGLDQPWPVQYLTGLGRAFTGDLGTSWENGRPVTSLLAEGFAATIRSLASYRGEGPLEAWVWRAVVNAAKKQQRHSSPTALEGHEPTSRQNGDETEVRLIRTWSAALPERQRLIVYLRYYADLDYRQIASVLDIAVGTVSATLSAAHQILRNLQIGERADGGELKCAR